MGTMKAATSKTVSTAIKHVAQNLKTVSTAIKHVAQNLKSLTVKKMFQVHNGIIKRWWHVVRGFKTDNKLLESDWNKNKTELQPLLTFSTSISPVLLLQSEEEIAVGIGHFMITIKCYTGTMTMRPVSIWSFTQKGIVFSINNIF